jgi:ankyrin repeat protein
VNAALPDTGETPLHNALCHEDRVTRNPALEVLLAHGANPNARTRKGAPTGAFMRDVCTRGETPRHRAAACGTVHTLQLLLKTGADKTLTDMNGDFPLTWASWHRRAADILRLLCFGEYRVHAEYRRLGASRLGGHVVQRKR